LTYRLELDKNDLLTLASAVLFSFSYVTSPFSFFIFFAFVPLIQSVENSKNYKEALKVGYLVGLIVNALVFYWIIYYKFDSYILNIILNPIQFAVFAYLYYLLKAYSHKIRILIFPLLWTFLEYIREFGDLALNWLNIGYTQGNYLSLIQFADISGLTGIVFWICIINVIIYNLFFKVLRFNNTITNYVLLLLLFLIPYVYGRSQLNNSANNKYVLVSYFQPNVDSKLKWNKNKYKSNINNLIKNSEKYLSGSAGLLIWPETAIPASYQKLGQNSEDIKRFVKSIKSPVLTGILFEEDLSKYDQEYNSAILFSSTDSTNQIYHKIKMVPFEEVLPYQKLYDYLLPGEIIKKFYKEGTEETVFTTDLPIYINNNKINMETVKFSAVICFESSFPSFVRKFVNNGAEFLVVITNDEWFGYTTQSIQHLITSRFRAIENRKSIIHCSNAGISSFIDFNGTFYGRSELLQNHAETQLVALNNDNSIFGFLGDWIGKISTIFILVTFILIFYKYNKKSK